MRRGAPSPEWAKKPVPLAFHTVVEDKGHSFKRSITIFSSSSVGSAQERNWTLTSASLNTELGTLVNSTYVDFLFFVTFYFDMISSLQKHYKNNTGNSHLPFTLIHQLFITFFPICFIALSVCVHVSTHTHCFLNCLRMSTHSFCSFAFVCIS